MHGLCSWGCRHERGFRVLGFLETKSETSRLKQPKNPSEQQLSILPVLQQQTPLLAVVTWAWLLSSFRLRRSGCCRGEGFLSVSSSYRALPLNPFRLLYLVVPGCHCCPSQTCECSVSPVPFVAFTGTCGLRRCLAQI